MQIVKPGSYKMADEFDKKKFEESKITFGCPRCRCVFTGYLMDPDDTMNMEFLDKTYAKCPFCEYNAAYAMAEDELRDLRRPLDEIDLRDHPEWAQYAKED